MEITNEMVFKIFGAYLGSDAICKNCVFKTMSITIDGALSGYQVIGSGYMGRNPLECKLVLKPLYELSEEDAMQVAQIMCDKQYMEIHNLKIAWKDTANSEHKILVISFSSYQTIKHAGDIPCQHIIHITTWGTINHYVDNQLGNCVRAIHIIDYLRSKGYALLYMGIDLFKAGIAIPLTKDTYAQKISR